MNHHIKYILFFLLGINLPVVFANEIVDNVVNIPFETYNDFIIVDLILAEKLPLKFIFDTGAESTIITKREIAEVLGLQYDKRFRILGADLTEIMYARRVKNVSILLDGMNTSRQNILVLEDDYFNFEEFLGLGIHGIMGMDMFENYVIEINYQRKFLTLTPKEHFKKPSKKFVKIPITVSKNKPYIDTKLVISQDTTLDLVFLIDTGASITAMIHNNTHPDLKIPDKSLEGNLGMGLGGKLEGYISIVPSFGFGNFQFDELLVNYMEVSEKQAEKKPMKYNGIIGNILLSRFHIIIDFSNSFIYLKPTRKYNKAFEFDKSGISVIAAGERLNRFFIQKPVVDSPSDMADIKRGDEIIRLNGRSWRFLNLSKINSILSKKEGKRIKMTIKRKEQQMKKEFYLRKIL